MVARTSEFLATRIHSRGPKRLLALDGAGARNALTLPILEAIESALQQSAHNSEQRLCDYFDVIGGTNTGAVIAALLARGMRVRKVQEHFRELTTLWFRRRGLVGRLTSKYRGDEMAEALGRTFGDEPLQGGQLLTALCIFAYRVDRQTLVAFHNLAPENETATPLPLREYLRASLAMPTYFEPVSLVLTPDDTGLFMDADLAMTGGAATPLFLTTTSPKEPFQLPIGEQNIFLTAVGVGEAPLLSVGSEAQGRTVLGWASALPGFLFRDARRQNELFLRAIARNLPSAPASPELSEVDADLFLSDPNLSYLRYDVDFSALGALGLQDLIADAERLTSLDDAEAWDSWIRIGQAVARSVDPSHFSAAQRYAEAVSE